MSYIAPLDPKQADAETAGTLEAVRKKVGMVPRLYATLAKAPAGLKGLLQISEAIAGGKLTAREREIVALAVAQANRCHYCLSAHTLLGKSAGMTVQETIQARSGLGGDARGAAIAGSAKALVEQCGQVAQRALDDFRAAGLSEEDLLEIVANVAASTLTNYANNVARTEIDFPVVPAQLVA